MVVIATLIRFWIDPYLPPGFPYLTFFPSVILTGFVFGLGPALISALLCGLSAWYWFIPPAGSFGVSSQSLVALGFFVVVVAIDLGVLQLALLAYRNQARTRLQLEHALELQQVVSREVDHRMKNLLATVTGLVSMSSRHAVTARDLAAHVNARVRSMSSAVDVLRGSLHGADASLHQVVANALATLGIDDGGRAQLTGPHIALNSTSIVTLNLVVHELATNAIKYGALSVPEGMITVSWSVEGDDVLIRWHEIHGPKVAQPSRTGFGTDLVERMALGLGGAAQVEYREAGVDVTISVKARLLSAA